jgi:hypothetical protein
MSNNISPSGLTHFSFFTFRFSLFVFCVSRLEGREAGAKHGAKRTPEGGDPVGGTPK